MALSREPSAENSKEELLVLFLLPYLTDSKSHPPTHTQFNISEMEMGLAVDDKKV